MESVNTIKCRKCGGPHLTIKCGKKVETTEIVEKIERKPFVQNKSYKAKMSNLPTDMSYEELSELLKDWGHFNRINIRNYDSSSVAFVEFKFEDELEYFISALDNTPFESVLLNVVKID
uniref:RRM domain-containing protein n=1 Tax=viral metagenome TaxID=1070528 RepID=A0A6C0D9Q1_9ZZZZ